MTRPKLEGIPQNLWQELLETSWLIPLAVYGAKKFFGEASLNEDASTNTRAGTAICTKDCKALSLTRDEYQKFLQRIQQKKLGKKSAFLKSLPMFKSWPMKWLNRLQDSLEEVQFIRKQSVYLEGDPADDVFLIHYGEFLLTKRVPIKSENQVQLDKLIGPQSVGQRESEQPIE